MSSATPSTSCGLRQEMTSRSKDRCCLRHYRPPSPLDTVRGQVQHSYRSFKLLVADAALDSLAAFLRPKSESGVRRIKYPSGKEARRSTSGLKLPALAPAAGMGSCEPFQGCKS